MVLQGVLEDELEGKGTALEQLKGVLLVEN